MMVEFPHDDIIHLTNSAPDMRALCLSIEALYDLLDERLPEPPLQKSRAEPLRHSDMVVGLKVKYNGPNSQVRGLKGIVVKVSPHSNQAQTVRVYWYHNNSTRVINPKFLILDKDENNGN